MDYKMIYNIWINTLCHFSRNVLHSFKVKTFLWGYNFSNLTKKLAEGMIVLKAMKYQKEELRQ